MDSYKRSNVENKNEMKLDGKRKGEGTRIFYTNTSQGENDRGF